MVDAEEMQECRTVLMRLTKRESGSRVVSSDSLEWRSERRNKVSGPARSLPGIWTIFRLKSARSRSHLACHLFSF